ncbi:MAG: HEAT repeat domain-containing protein, partial [Candidatus Lokiarchaeota archaeon]
ISEIDNLNPKILPFNTILENLKHPDSKVRESAANLIKVYKLEEINKIFNDILRLLEDKSEDVRKSMINSLVLIINEIGLKNLLNRLLQNLSDEVSLDLQRSVATILKRTAKYSNEDIKKRIIALLKIRCEMSQDPIICDAFHQIKES